MNWKQFGKAQMLSEEEYADNITLFMNVFGIDYHIWQDLKRLADLRIALENSEYLYTLEMKYIRNKLKEAK